jgi:hypothetical protein
VVGAGDTLVGGDSAELVQTETAADITLTVRPVPTGTEKQQRCSGAHSGRVRSWTDGGASAAATGVDHDGTPGGTNSDRASSDRVIDPSPGHVDVIDPELGSD